MRIIVAFIILIQSSFAYCDELLVLPSVETGFLSNASPTQVMLWNDPNEKNLVVFFPGGEGNFKMDRVWRRAYMTGIGKVATIIPHASGAFVNSPYSLGHTYSASGRFTDKHIARMINALEVLKQKTEKPIWIWGHSNGSISALEVYAQLEKMENTGLVQGLILTGARDIMRIPEKMNIPFLFIHHQADACADTPLGVAQRNYEKLKNISSARNQFSVITTYIPPAGNPCLTGVHMFDNVYEEVAKIIADFIER